MPIHALVIGGTGMLRGVSKHLLNEFNAVSVIARNDDGFKKLASETDKLSAKLNKLKVDYSHYHELTSALMKAVKEFGEISLAVSWIHSTAPLAGTLIAKVLNHSQTKCDFYEITGSAEPAQDNVENSRGKFKIFGNVNYHLIKLGSVSEGGASRWLSDDEISKGVIEAIRGDHKEFTVGSS
jgi:hypothetical protein